MEMMTIMSELHDCSRHGSNLEVEWSELHDSSRHGSNLEVEWYIHIIFYCDFLS